jgi:hypothetical protein
VPHNLSTVKMQAYLLERFLNASAAVEVRQKSSMSSMTLLVFHKLSPTKAKYRNSPWDLSDSSNLIRTALKHICATMNLFPPHHIHSLPKSSGSPSLKVGTHALLFVRLAIVKAAGLRSFRRHIALTVPVHDKQHTYVAVDHVVTDPGTCPRLPSHNTCSRRRTGAPIS